jgi:hypothetical protein
VAVAWSPGATMPGSEAVIGTMNPDGTPGTVASYQLTGGYDAVAQEHFAITDTSIESSAGRMTMRFTRPLSGTSASEGRRLLQSSVPFVRGELLASWFSLEFRLSSSIKPISSPPRLGPAGSFRGARSPSHLESF